MGSGSSGDRALGSHVALDAPSSGPGCFLCFKTRRLVIVSRSVKPVTSSLQMYVCVYLVTCKARQGRREKGYSPSSAPRAPHVPGGHPQPVAWSGRPPAPPPGSLVQRFWGDMRRPDAGPELHGFHFSSGPRKPWARARRAAVWPLRAAHQLCLLHGGVPMAPRIPPKGPWIRSSALRPPLGPSRLGRTRPGPRRRGSQPNRLGGGSVPTGPGSLPAGLAFSGFSRRPLSPNLSREPDRLLRL